MQPRRYFPYTAQVFCGRETGRASSKNGRMGAKNGRKTKVFLKIRKSFCFFAFKRFSFLIFYVIIGVLKYQFPFFTKKEGRK